MPVVDYGRNIVDTFGINLPIPYVNKVTLRTDSIDATISLYFSLNVEDDIDTFLSGMQELNVYVVPVVDAQLATAEQMVDAYGSFIGTSDMSDSEALDLVYGAGYDAIDSSRRTTKAHNVIKEKADILRYISGLSIEIPVGATEDGWAGDTASIPLFEPYVTPSSYTSPVGDEYTQDQLVLLLPQISSTNETTWAYQLDLSDFTLVSTEVQDNAANTIYKFNADVQLQFASTVGQQDETMTNTYVFEALKANLSLFCFSTPLELNGEEFFDTIKPAALEKNGLSELYRSCLSPLSYQNVLENGDIIDQKTTSYQYSSGVSFYGTPIQALDGTYHDTDPAFLQKIINYFQPMLGRVSETSFQQAINNLAFIVATYKNTPEFLLKLNEFKATFYDKSGQTSVSRWFSQVSDVILRTNSEVMSRALLTRYLMSRRVIVDKRAASSAGYSAPEQVELSSMQTDYVYMKEALIHRNGIFSSELGQAMENFQSGEHYTSFDQGFFLFDYEKALRTTSELSKMFDIQKVEAIVGRDILHNHFLLKSAVLDRHCWTDSIDSGFTGTTSFPEEKTTKLTQLKAVFNDLFYWEEAADEEAPPASYPELLEITQDTPATEYQDAVHTSYTISADGVDTSYTPSLLLRNFNTLNGTLDNYRMMCFEFTQILESNGGYNTSPRDDDILYATITCRDATKYIASDLIMQYMRSLNEIEKYLALAQEYCSYDNTAEVFNDFFIEYINTQYDDTTTAPWIVYPLIYNVHLDLVTDVWGGDNDRIVAESIKITDLISPESGRLENLEDFVNNYRDFASQFYMGSGASVGAVFSSLQSETTKEYGGNRNIYWPLPKVDFMDLYQSYTSEDAAADQALANIEDFYNTMWQHFIERAEILNDKSTPDSQVEDIKNSALEQFKGFLEKIRENLAAMGATWTFNMTQYDDEALDTGNFDDASDEILPAVVQWLEKNSYEAYASNGYPIKFVKSADTIYMTNAPDKYNVFPSSDYGLNQDADSSICSLGAILKDQFLPGTKMKSDRDFLEDDIYKYTFKNTSTTEAVCKTSEASPSPHD
jgi:hypothetical protein